MNASTPTCACPERRRPFLDLNLLEDNPFQPRTTMDPTYISELASSLARVGLIQPIAVRPVGPGRYQIVGGHCRVAYRMLLAAATTEPERRKYELIRAVVAATTDAEMAITAYVENVQRSELSPADEAAALAQIRELEGHATAAQVAKAVSQPERRVRRLTAPAVVKDCVSTGLLVDVNQPRSEPATDGA